jgi:electron transfer DM13
MRRFLKGLVIFLIGGVVGTALGVFVGFFVYPFVFPPPPAVEQLTEADKTPLASGTFIHANPSDRLHWGRGRVSLYERAVFLEPDFEVGPGPAYHVYLVPKAGIRKNSDLGDAKFVDLGGLRSFKGSQRYPIPDGVDLKNYQSVIIWCRDFSALISPADLTLKQSMIEPLMIDTSATDASVANSSMTNSSTTKPATANSSMTKSSMAKRSMSRESAAK